MWLNRCFTVSINVQLFAVDRRKAQNDGLKCRRLTAYVAECLVWAIDIDASVIQEFEQGVGLLAARRMRDQHGHAARALHG